MLNVMFGKSFNSGKCKTLLKLAVSRIKLLKNKRDIQVKQLRRDLALLLQTSQDPSARIRVEHIMREENTMAAYEIIELFCELIAVRLPIIESQRECPIDLREAISSLIFAAPRCADLPELLQIRSLFAAKYGKEFVAAAAELRPDCGVNRRIIEKLSVRAPTGEAKLKLMKDIAAEHNVDWDSTESEAELLKLPEDLLEGPNQFLGASQIPISGPSKPGYMIDAKESYDEDPPKPPLQKNSSTNVSTTVPNTLVKKELPNVKQFIPFVSQVPENSQPRDPDIPLATGPAHNAPLHVQSSFRQRDAKPANDIDAPVQAHMNVDDPYVKSMKKSYSESFSFKDYQGQTAGVESFKDVAAAAQAAAESADRAVAAARAAASLANERLSRQGSYESPAGSSSDSEEEVSSSNLPKYETKFRDDDRSKKVQPLSPAVPTRPVFDEFVEDESPPSAERVYRSRVDSLSSRSHLRRERSATGYEDQTYLLPGDQSISSANSRYRIKSKNFLAQQKSDSSMQRKSNDEAVRHHVSSILEPSVPRFDDSPSRLYPGPQDNDAGISRSQSDPTPEPHLPSTVFSKSNDVPSSAFQGNMSSKGPHIHPKLPNYDDLAARFQALKSKR